MMKQKGFLETCIEAYRERSFLQAYDNAFELLRAESDESKEQVFRLRYDVFCEENKFEKSPFSGEALEHDAYDDHAVHYLLRHRASGDMVGTVRVVLPMEDDPLHSFPVQAHCNHPLLKDGERALTLFEISRFCMAPRFRKRERDGRLLPAYYDQDMVDVVQNGRPVKVRRLIPYAPAALLKGAFETALAARIFEGVWMVDSMHLQSLDRIGFSFGLLGPYVNYHGGAQPVIFNIKHVLDNMRAKNRHCWDLISDLGALQTTADGLARNDWQDRLMDEEDMPSR